MTIEELRNTFADIRAKIDALPDTGSVLWNSISKLAICMPDGDPERGRAAGLVHAHIFSYADRHQRPAGVPGLDRLYTDGFGHRFILTDIKLAKRQALADIDAALSSFSQLEG
jgi:hypothetical protein